MLIDSLDFLSGLDTHAFLLVFWYMLLFELPRYFVSGIVTSVLALYETNVDVTPPDFTLSVILAGFNEGTILRTCVEGLAEQTFVSNGGRMQIVVVDDGSADNMAEVARALKGEAKIDTFLRLDHRGGKSAGVNLGLSACTGEIIIIADIDTTFNRDAIEQMIKYYADPKVGAVGGTLGVRNIDASLMTRAQAIEYSIGISLGRRIVDALGILTIVSGAFGSFRRTAIEQVGRQDTEVGEDADLTLKLRRAGWLVRFAPDARGLTDVPETVTGFIAQRMRWDRGLVTIWLRKFKGFLDPRPNNFRLKDAIVILDVVLFQVTLALVFPVYIIWLYYYFGSFATTVTIATFLIYAVTNVVAFLAAAALGLRTPFSLLLYLPFFTVLQITIMRAIRIIAILQEFLFRSSYRDPYVPSHVMRVVERV